MIHLRKVMFLNALDPADAVITSFVSLTAHDSRWSNAYCFNSDAFICEMKLTDKPFRKPLPPGEWTSR